MLLEGNKLDEMIDKALIKKLRTGKCWSQEHLALVSGLSLRTIQRIEKEGGCSIDSQKALAVVFELDAIQLSMNGVVDVLADDDKKIKTAVSWLNLVDSGAYANSWREAAASFQAKVSIEEWIAALDHARTPLGEVHSRELEKATEHDSLLGVPDGQYVVAIFSTSFVRKKSTKETVTLSEANDKLRVAGYFIS